MYGADDFLPCLTWVLLRSNLVTLQVDTDYMMELLDPTQLQGEGKPVIIQGQCRGSVMLHFSKSCLKLNRSFSDFTQKLSK